MTEGNVFPFLRKIIVTRHGYNEQSWHGTFFSGIRIRHSDIKFWQRVHRLIKIKPFGTEAKIQSWEMRPHTKSPTMCNF